MTSSSKQKKKKRDEKGHFLMVRNTHDGVERLCRECFTVKPLSQFYNQKTKNTVSKKTNCKTCDIQAKERSRKLRSRDRALKVVQYLLGHPCVDCGESDPIVLEFDHVNGKKKAGISQMVHTSSWRKIEEEIAKCVVRCSNCHARKTAIERRSYRVEILKELTDATTVISVSKR